MPLPPALLARLRKRGIVEADTQEEIIAESYDDEQPMAPPSHNQPSHSDTSLITTIAPYAHGCPNKTNPFHICQEYCHVHWGEGVVPESRRDPTYERRRQRMLRKYPLPSNDWRETYDPGLGRYYYWNVETDDVSWLSPTHPRAKIGVPASKLAKVEWDKLKIQEEQRKRQKQRQLEMEREREERGRARGRRRARRSMTPESGGESDQSDRVESEPDGDHSDTERGRKKKPEKRKLPRDLDPMDPAAYSDIPRGGWGAGLEMQGDAKTGVDTTANGPLFQQRPYPAPGAILRLNKEPPPKKKQAKGKGIQIGPVDPRRGNDSD